MRKFFAIIGMLFCCAVIYVGVQYLNGETQFIGGGYVSSPSSSSSAPSYYDSGYASFGGDFYTFVNNNAAEAAKAARTIASNQIQIFEQMFQIRRIITQFFGYILITFGGIGVCLFGVLCFIPKPVVPVSPLPSASPTFQPEQTNRTVDENGETEEKHFICEACGNTFTGWYQECPNCHTIGKMKKNS